MKIRNAQNKEIEVEGIKFITHNRSNDCVKYKTLNVDGESQKHGEKLITETEMKYVEFTVIGKRSKWIDWMELEIFEKNNPNFEME